MILDCLCVARWFRRGDIQESKRLPRSDLMVSQMRKINNKYIKVTYLSFALLTVWELCSSCRWPKPLTLYTDLVWF
jgi:hypothetical protein